MRPCSGTYEVASKSQEYSKQVLRTSPRRALPRPALWFIHDLTYPKGQGSHGHHAAENYDANEDPGKLKSARRTTKNVRLLQRALVNGATSCAAHPLYLLPAVHCFSIGICHSDTERRHENCNPCRIDAGPDKEIADLSLKQGMRVEVTEISTLRLAGACIVRLQAVFLTLLPSTEECAAHVCNARQKKSSVDARS